MSKECEHRYDAVVVKKQEVHSHYVSLDAGNKAVIIENETPVIFCINCGDKKESDHAIK